MPPQETTRVLPRGKYADGRNGVGSVCEQHINIRSVYIYLATTRCVNSINV